MNLWVLFLCRFLIVSRVKITKIILASVLTAVGEVLILCIPFGNSAVKVLAGFGSVTALGIYGVFRPDSLTYFYKLMIYFYFAVFVLGGILILLETFLGRKNISMFVWAVAVVFLVILIERIYIKLNAKSDFKEVVLTISPNKQCKLRALVDSGNGLTEPISKKPVSIVEEAALESYRKLFCEEKFRLVPFHSVGREHGMLEAYFIEKMEIRNEGENIIVQNPIIAITKERISVNGNYHMILNPNILEQGGRKFDF